MAKRLTIDELERLLNSENDWDSAIRILPDGTIERNTNDDWMWLYFGIEPPTPPKPLTLKERLGGEYGISHASR